MKLASTRPSSLLFRNLVRRLWLALVVGLLLMAETTTWRGKQQQQQSRLLVQGFVVPKIVTRGYNTISFPTKSALSATKMDEEDDKVLLAMEPEESSSLMDEGARPPSAGVAALSVPSRQTTDNYQVPGDPLEWHMLLLIAVTFPWYAFTSYEMMAGIAPDFFGLAPTMVSGLGLYVSLSQVAVYYFCTRLANATTLQEGQRLVGLMTCLCIPADVIGTLYEPTGSLGVTVVAFAMVTTAFGIFLAHYLRKAAYREIPPVGYSVITMENDEEDTVRRGHEEEEEGENVLSALQTYRPPPNPSSTKLAMDFTRAFVSFTISVSALGTFFAEGHDPNVWIVASLLSVLVHTSIECFLATTYPGVDLEEFDSYLIAESALYAVHMVATTIVSHEEGFGDTLVDQILWSWLFGSATGKLIDRMGKLLSKVDFDSKLGLSKFI